MSYADDNTPYVCSENVDITLAKLEEVGKVLFEWFSNNFLKANFFFFGVDIGKVKTLHF